MTRIAASAASGTFAAHWPANTRMSSSVTACSMPASGVRPPVWMFVAVRGNDARDPRPGEENDVRADLDARGRPIDRVEMSRVRHPLLDEIGGHGADVQSEKVFDLSREDDDGDAGREAGDDGIRDELDERAHARESHRDEQDAGDDGADDEAFVAVFRDDAVDDDDECASGTTDLDARAAEGGD